MTTYVKWARLAGLPQDPSDLLGLPVRVDQFLMPVLRTHTPLMTSDTYTAYITGFNVTDAGICLFVDGEGDLGTEFPYLAFDGKSWAWVERYDTDRGAGWMRGYPCRVTIYAPVAPPVPQPVPVPSAGLAQPYAAPWPPYEKVPRLTPRLTPYFLTVMLAASLVLLYLSR